MRVGIIGKDQVTSDVPEYTHMKLSRGEGVHVWRCARAARVLPPGRFTQTCIPASVLTQSCQR